MTPLVELIEDGAIAVTDHGRRWKRNEHETQVSYSTFATLGPFWTVSVVPQAKARARAGRAKEMETPTHPPLYLRAKVALATRTSRIRG